MTYEVQLHLRLTLSSESSEQEELPLRQPRPSSVSTHDHCENADGLQRRLNNRQIQLIAIGGSIGTGLFIGIGAGLAKGGAGSLLVCTVLYAAVLALVNNSIAEMSTYMPVSGGFLRLAGEWVDDAMGFMVGWNFFLYEALLIPFEIVALNLVLSFWSDEITKPGPTAGFCAAIIIVYGRILALRRQGPAHLHPVWLYLRDHGRRQPQHDAYGFRFWKDPQDAFATYRTLGDLGRLEGFMGALASVAFFVVGPDYISMVAAEAKHPSVYIKTAFKTVYFRFGLFFIGAALTCGIVVAHNDPALVQIHLEGGGGATAAASPTLALEGRAPAFLRKTTKKGVPIYCFCVTMLFPFLSFLQLDSSSAEALSILLSLITGGGIVDYISMSITFLFFYRACKVQGLDRKTLPYYGYFQPYGAWIALVLQIIVVYTYGYTSLAPFDVTSFFSNYTMQILAPLMFVGWKLLKRTKFVKPEECDLVWDRPIIDAYEERMMIEEPPTTFWQEIKAMVGFKPKKTHVAAGEEKA
ncbi:unnamed protein product [Parascedosporium putredinis]|uniref:Amino acid permease/ SLC12A domain-containing protein n=1 Tax=Parascedosporium putredinis TaxID=1442378 RepID=A0A9P1H1R1_9PEZI|nr:unnamed protein product [Parascedosporium putredinis]CAI7993923.1 unnamed protein product [Parascedosporium putredinis]